MSIIDFVSLHELSRKVLTSPWVVKYCEKFAYYEGEIRDGWQIEGPEQVPDYDDTYFTEDAANYIVKACNAVPNLMRTIQKSEGRNLELQNELNFMIKSYINLYEFSRDEIRGLGGDCDPVDVMERKSKILAKAKRVLANVK